MKILKCQQFYLLLSFFTILTHTLNSQQHTLTNDQTAPLIIEYINKFKLPANDLNYALNNQFKTITTGTIKTSYVIIDQAHCNLTYKNHSTTTYLSPLKVQVKNDTFNMNCSFQVNVTHLVNKKKYNCYALSSDITVNYTKEVDFVSGNTTITSFSSSYAPLVFKSGGFCVEKESAKDKVRIDEAITNTESSSLYNEVKKTLDKMKSVFQQNTQTQHLSQIYPENPYVYDYYGYKIDINVSTLQTERYGEEGLVNMIRGTIPGTSHSPTSTPPSMQGYNLFLSKQFIQNAIQYSITNYQGWKNVKANRTNMRTDYFKFRLIDYQYITPAVLKRFPKNYLADTDVQCKALNYKNLKLNQKNITLQINWSCLAGFEPVQGSRYNFLNFQATIQYQIMITAGTSLTVYSKPTKTTSLAFNIIDDNIIDQIQIVKIHIDSGLFQFQTYTIGTFMIIKPNSSTVKITQSGIWIG